MIVLLDEESNSISRYVGKLELLEISILIKNTFLYIHPRFPVLEGC